MCNPKTIRTMKKILLCVSAVMAMMTLTALFSACSSSDEEKKATSSPLCFDGIKAEYEDEESGTRALSPVDNTIKTYWLKTDDVKVFRNNWQEELGTLHPEDDTDGSENVLRTKLAGDITSTHVKTSEELNLILPRATWQYTDQDGKLETISKQYDYATANVNVVFIDVNDNNKIYATTANFKTQQSIARFTLLDKKGNALLVPELTITAASNQLVTSCSLNGEATAKGPIVIKPSEPTNVFYVAIRNVNEGPDQYTLTAKVGEQVYTYTRSNITLANGRFKKFKVNMKLSDDTYTERDAYIDEGEEVWD